MEIKSEQHLREHWDYLSEELKIRCIKEIEKAGVTKDDTRMIEFLEFFDNSKKRHLETLIERWKNKEIERNYVVNTFFEITFAYEVNKMKLKAVEG